MCVCEIASSNTSQSVWALLMRGMRWAALDRAAGGSRKQVQDGGPMRCVFKGTRQSQSVGPVTRLRTRLAPGTQPASRRVRRSMLPLLLPVLVRAAPAREAGGVWGRTDGQDLADQGAGTSGREPCANTLRAPPRTRPPPIIELRETLRTIPRAPSQSFPHPYHLPSPHKPPHPLQLH